MIRFRARGDRLPVFLLASVLCATLLLSGCGSDAGSAFLGGAAGAAASAGGYELHLKRQRERVKEDFDAGRIDREEYEIRLDQIDRDSPLR